ncbi:GntR family transcriptional regulator [Pseudomonas trivialis]|uniref:GntR family transcriptional regulator n=1 Tax=Pseudomonas trivialis TaxID=200450 RepID=UPI0030CF4140
MNFLTTNTQAPAANLSAVEVLAAKLKARILNGDFEPGEFLRDIKMAEEYEVARNTFRSAAQLLVTFGSAAQSAASRLLHTRVRAERNRGYRQVARGAGNRSGAHDYSERRDPT